MEEALPPMSFPLRQTQHRRNVAMAVLVAMALFAVPSAADEVDACVHASESAQKQFDQGQYLAARDNLLRCARDVCPAAVRKVCVADLEKLDAMTPTVVFGVTGLSSARIGAVRVHVAGRQNPYPIDGQPVRFDPGTTAFRFEHGGVSKQVTLVLKAGEKNRPVETSFETTPVPGDSATTTSTPATHSTPWLGYSLLGVGGVALGGMAWMWVKGRGDVDELRDGCGATRTCDQADIDSARTTILVGDVLGGVGLVSIGVGTFLLLDGSAEPSAGPMRMDGTLGRGEASVRVAGEF